MRSLRKIQLNCKRKAEGVAGIKKSEKNDKLSPETKGLLRKRSEIYKKFINKTSINKIEYIELCKTKGNKSKKKYDSISSQV